MSESYILENDKIKLTISTDGAQIYNFIYKEDDSERIWNGDPTYWKQRNPILFPQVGNTYDKTQVFKGKEYHMGNHGFARYSEFKLVSKDENSLVLSLKDDDTTYSQYPYHFTMEVKYTLFDAKVEIAYRIKNDDEETMPFGFGLHPAFRCPIYDGENFEDYKLIFSSNEGEGYPELDLIKDHKIDLNYDIFDTFPTICYHDLISNTISLSNGKHGMHVSAVGYPYWGIWTPKAPFICIEPWFSHGDEEEVKLPFDQREGIIKLTSGDTFYFAYSIEAF